jgi:hypothetical protein
MNEYVPARSQNAKVGHISIAEYGAAIQIDHAGKRVLAVGNQNVLRRRLVAIFVV